MADAPEDVFAAEAREETLLSQVEEQSSGSQNSKTQVRTYVHENDGDGLSEETPLVSSEDGVRRRQNYTRAGKSYDRAINEPWTGAQGAGSLPWYKRPSIYWLLPAFFPYCVAFGGVIVPRTYLVLNLICKDYLSEKASKDPMFHHLPVIFGGGENPQCRDYHVQQRTAWFNIYSDLLAGLFSAIVTPHVGALSDRIGRKKVIIIASFGGLVSEIITIIVGSHPETVSVYWLLLGSLADGLCGSFTAAMALAFAYASDCSAPEKRAVAFGYFQGTLFSGIALGPILAGYLIKVSGTVMVVFYVALGCHLFFILFTTFVVPESLSKERQLLAREKHALKKAETADEAWMQLIKKYNLFEPLWVLRPTGEGSSPTLRKNLLVLATIDTMMFGVAMGTMRILLIYAEYRFGWDAVDASMFLSGTNICRVTGLIILLPLLNRVFRGRGQTQFAGHRGSNKVDIGIIRVSILFDLIGYLGYAIAPTGAVMVVSGLIASVGGIGSPTLQSSITKHIPADRTGQVLGAAGLLHALARVIAPAFFNLIYSLTVQYYAGIVFFCLASIFVFVFIISWLLKPNIFFQESISLSSEQEDDGGDEAPSA